MNHNKSLFAKFLFFFAFSIIALQFSAQHYWVGGSGNWTDYSTHWATTSGGSTFHTAEPSENDDVYFDANSFSETGQAVTISEQNSYCRNIDWSGAQFFPSMNMEIIYSYLDVYGSVILNGDVNYNIQRWRFNSTTANNSITTNGAEMGVYSNFIIDCDTGVYNLEDDFNSNTLTLDSGTLNTNNNTITTEFEIKLIGGSSLIFNLGSSEIFTSIWNADGEDGMNINAQTSTINVALMYASNDGQPGFNYNNVVLSQETSKILGSGTFNVIDALACAGGNLEFSVGGIITCNDLILASDIHAPTYLNLYGNEAGYATINKTSGSLNLSYAELSDIHTTGGATFTIDPGVDHGNNDGWSFTEIITREFYWINNGGNWSDTNHWSSESGGSADYNDYPSKYDNANLDENSFSITGQEVTFDMYTGINDLIWTASGQNPSSFSNYESPVEVFGDISIADEVSSFFYNLTLKGESASSVFFGAETYVQNISFNDNNNCDIDSDISCANFSLFRSSVNTNSHTITSSIAFNINMGAELDLGSSDLFLNNFRVNTNSANAVIETGTSTIHVTSEFRAGGFYYNHVVVSGEPIIKDDNIFGTLEFEPGVNCELKDGSVQTINENLIIEGLPNLPIIIKSSENGTTATLSKSSGTVNAFFVTLQDNIATGGAIFNADQSIDNGNNTGWNIIELQPQDYYWVGNEGDWTDSDNHWATTSGGNTFYNYPPGSLDDVYFDENSFSTNDQAVILDQDVVFFHTMDWSNVTNNPTLSGYEKTINCYGSLIFSENMYTNVSFFNFLGTGNNTIHPAYENSPNDNAEFTFSSGGTWDVTSPLTLWNLTLESGIINMNGNDLDVGFQTYFDTEQYKEFNLGANNFHSRSLSWLFGNNLVFDGSESSITSSSSFSPFPYFDEDNVTVLLNNLHLTFDFNNVVHIGSDIVLNQLSIEPGIELQIREGKTITLNELIVDGTAEDFISIKCEDAGFQSFISKAEGSVFGQFLELQDISGIGGADFYADNSIDNGNVSGWIFTGVAQTIDFPQIENVLETIGSINLIATASSGLDVIFEVIDGDATIVGNVLTINAAGSITIQATQAGDLEFNPAPSQSVTFCSNPIAPIISEEDVIGYVALTPENNQECYWFFEGTQLNAIPVNLYNVNQLGDYHAQTVVDGCVSDLSNVITVTSVSVDEIMNLTTISVYPNPVVDQLVISLSQFDNSVVEIYNSIGELIGVNTYNSKEMKIDFSTFEAGIYFVNVIIENEKTSSTIIKR